MTPDDYKRLHALCVAAIGRCWSETDMIVSHDVVTDGLVEFSDLGTPCLTEDGRRVLRDAVAGMKGAL